MGHLRDLGLFLKSVGSHWVSLVMGGAVFMLLMFGERLSQKSAPPLLYWLTAGGAFLFATFKAWQDEKCRADEAEGDLSHAKAADAGLIIREITNDEFWLLSHVQKHGVRRELNSNLFGGLSAYTVVVGETPLISHWLHGLAAGAVKRGLLTCEENRGIGTYWVPAEIAESLAAERRAGRRVVEPSEALNDARTGELVKLEV